MKVIALSFISVLLGLSPPKTKRRSLRLFYKIYCLTLIVSVIYETTWAAYGRDDYNGEKLTGILDSTLNLLGALTNMIAILQGMFSYRQIDYFYCNTAPTYNKILGTQEILDRKAKIFSRQLSLLHVLCPTMFSIMIYASQFVLEWRLYKYFFVPWTFHWYMVTMMLMAFRVHVEFLITSFAALNKKLSTCLGEAVTPSRFVTTQEINPLQCINLIQSMHHTLCDLIESLNKVFGVRMLFIVLYTSVALLEGVEVLVNFWNARDFRTNVCALASFVLTITLLLFSLRSVIKKSLSSSSLISYRPS